MMCINTRLGSIFSLLACLVLVVCASWPAPLVAAQPVQGEVNQPTLESNRQLMLPVQQELSSVQGMASNISAISTGESHACALTIDGGVKCWGYNGSGQLGDGTNQGRSTPVDVSGLTSGIQAVSAGDQHTCALTAAGGVTCWGSNEEGQLGDGTHEGRSTPVDVSGLTSGVRAVSAGDDHTCALTTAGAVKCWGDNRLGQLGDGSFGDRLTPADVSDLASGVQAVSAGGQHTCALTTGGGVKCWGYNGDGQLGDGTTNMRPTPGDVSGLTSGVQSISAKTAHTCAVTTNSGVKCWGHNGSGRLGDGTTTGRPTPVDVSGMPGGVQTISAGYHHTCAVTASGEAKCWGENEFGKLGDGTTASRLAPVDVNGLTSGVQSIAAGYDFTCALTTGGVKCWGNKYYGQLGDGTNGNYLTPVDAGSLSSTIQAIAVGDMHTCALTTSGGVKCWGYNSQGQLGDGTLYDSMTPVDVTGLTSGVQAISSGSGHACALTTGGGVKCWGGNGVAQLGDGTTTNHATPVDVTGLTSGVQAIATGTFHTCALTTMGGIKCWGYNDHGQLGDGTTTNSAALVDVSGLTSGVKAIAAGYFHTCALTTNGGVKCWGRNDSGQLGNETQTDQLTPVGVTGLTSGVQVVSAGGSHTCALTTGGGAKCWGYNEVGQLGDGTTNTRPTPGDVSGLTSAVQTISAGGNHTCAVTTGGAAKCWGYNEVGKLGDGTPTKSALPVDVTGLSAGVKAISAREWHTCALTTAGGVKCWGGNQWGQLGINPGWLPVDVMLDKARLFLPLVKA
jgi:alpha-tubulin suppressor-like RCC1 family protein